MVKQKLFSTKSEHKRKLRDIRLKNLEKKLKSNILKRKKNKKNG